MKKQLITSVFINTLMIVLAILACFMQLLIDDSSENIASASIAMFGSLCLLFYLRYSNSYETNPMSTFALFGFCATGELGALLVQSFSLTSLAKNLRQPIDTFAVLALFQLVAIAAHMAYRFFSVTEASTDSIKSERKWFSLRSLFDKLDVYVIPTVSELWVLGLIGLVAILSSGTGAVNPSVLNKIGVGISFLAWAPFLIPINIAVANCITSFWSVLE